MAKVVIYRNVFDTSDVISTEKSGISIEELLRANDIGNISESQCVEVYDPATGETSFETFNGEGDVQVSVKVNDEEKGLDYVIREIDVVAIVVLPASDAESASTALKTAGGITLAVGLLAAILLTGGAGALAAGGVLAGFSGLATATTMLAWAAVGGAVGIIGAGLWLAGNLLGDAADSSKEKTKQSDDDADKLPTIKGSKNQSIIGDTIPAVTGRINVTPRIVSSPVTYLDTAVESYTSTTRERKWTVSFKEGVEYKQSLLNWTSTIRIWHSDFKIASSSIVDEDTYIYIQGFTRHKVNGTETYVTLGLNNKLTFLVKANRNEAVYIPSEIPFTFNGIEKIYSQHRPAFGPDFVPEFENDQFGYVVSFGTDITATLLSELQGNTARDITGNHNGVKYAACIVTGDPVITYNMFRSHTDRAERTLEVSETVTSASTMSDSFLNGIFGQNQHADELLMLGYSPVLVKNIQFDGLTVAKNPNNVISGTMQCSTDENGDIDVDTQYLEKYGEEQTFNGKTLSKEVESSWNINKPQFELTQFGEERNICRFVDKQEFSDTPLLYCYDNEYSAIAREQNIQWQGGTFKAGYRNTVRKFSSGLPKKITVGIDFPQGLYSEYTDDDGQYKYSKIPMNLVIQWRPRYRYIDSGNGAKNGLTDEETAKVYDGTSYDATRYGRWRNFDDGIVKKNQYFSAITKYTYYNFNNEPVVYPYMGANWYGRIEIFQTLSSAPQTLADLSALGGTFYPEKPASYTQAELDAYVSKRAPEIARNKGYIREETRSKTVWYLFIPVKTYYTETVDEYTGRADRIAECEGLAQGEFTAQRTAYYTEYSTKENTHETASSNITQSAAETKRNVGLSDNTDENSNPTWNGVMAFAFGKFSCGPKCYSEASDPTNNYDDITFTNPSDAKNEMRFEISAELSQEDILDLINRNPKTIKAGEGSDEELIGQTDVVFDSVEIRIVRLTPCYLEGQKDISPSDTPKYTKVSYSDVVKVSYIRTECLDKQKLLNDIDYIPESGDAPIIDCRKDTYLTSGTWNTWNINDYRWKTLNDEDNAKCATLGIRVVPDQLGYIQNSIDKTSMDIMAITPAMKESHVRYWYNDGTDYYSYDSYNDFTDQTEFEKSLYIHPEFDALTWIKRTAAEFTEAGATALTGHANYWWERKAEKWDRLFYPEVIEKKYQIEPMLDVNGELKLNADGKYMVRKEQYGNSWTNYIQTLIKKNTDSLGRIVVTDDFIKTFTEQNAIAQALYLCVHPGLGKEAMGYNATSLNKYITYWLYTEGETTCSRYDSYDTEPKSYSWFEVNSENIQWDASSPQDFAASEAEAISGAVYWSYRRVESDINMNTLAEAYLYTDAIDIGNGPLSYKTNRFINRQTKFETVLQNALNNARAFWFYDDMGRIEIHNDRKLKNPVLVINDENAISPSNTRSFAKGIAGYHVTFKDEDNGGKDGEMYVLRQGQSVESHTRDIVELSLDGVTSAYQAKDFALYMLAQSIAQRETWTRKLNQLGGNLTVGSLVEIQGTSLKIGTDNGARIMSLIEDDDYIYGFITDLTYVYMGEYDSDGRNTQGVVVMQSHSAPNSRTLKLRLASEEQQEDGIEDENGNVYKNIPADTNMILFEKKIDKATHRQVSTDEEREVSLEVDIDLREGDLVGFGTMGSMTSLAIVSSLEPDETGGVTASMYPYYESVYDAAKGLPVYISNLSKRATSAPPVVSMEVSRGEMYTQLAEQSVQTAEAIQGVVNGDSDVIKVPSKVTGVTATAVQEGISVAWTEPGQGLSNSIMYYEVELSKDSGSTWSASYNPTTCYITIPFDRSTDGYPEPGSFTNWRVRVRARNVYNMTGEYSNVASVNDTGYLTWNPPTPINLTAYPSENTMLFAWDATSGSRYGTTRFNIKRNNTVIAKNVTSPWTYTFDRNTDGYPESSDFTPSDFNFAVEATNESGNTQTSSGIVFNTNNYLQWVPTQPKSVKAIAERDTITLNWETGGGYYGSSKYFEVLKNGTVIATDVEGCSYTYTFNRSQSEYPETSDFSDAAWQFKIRACNESTTPSGNYTDSDNATYDTTHYGTWELQIPNVTQKVTERTVILTITQPARADGKIIYGNIKNLIRIKRDENYYYSVVTPEGTENPSEEGWYEKVDNTLIPTTDTTVDANKTYYEKIGCTQDSQWYAPATSSDPYASEDNYKDTQATDAYIETQGTTYVQILPLYGQGPDGEGSNRINTRYLYDVKSKNEVNSSDWITDSGDPITVIAEFTSLRDYVKANLTAKSEVVESLSAISANLGEISDGSLTGDNNNFWTLSTKENPTSWKDYKGAFRVGNEKEYLRVMPEYNGREITGYTIELRAGNISFSGSSSTTGELNDSGTYIYDDNNPNARLELTYQGMSMQLSNDDGATWKEVGAIKSDSNGNLVITNDDNLNVQYLNYTKKPNGNTNFRTYHFNTDANDEDGNNNLSLVCVGSVKSGASPLLSGGGVWEGTVTEDLNNTNSSTVFLTKGNKLLVDGDYIDTTGTSDVTKVNDINSAASTSWGLTATQVANKIFAWE